MSDTHPLFRPITASLVVGLAAFILAGPDSGGEEMVHHHATPSASACSGIDIACASSATPLLLADGSLIVAWAGGGVVSVGRSGDLGKSFETTTRLSDVAAKLDTGPDSRPILAVDRSGRVVVAYSIMRDDRWNGQILVAQSSDGGRHFTAPQPLADSDAGQRFASLAFDPDGALFAAWIDKRNAVLARIAGQSYVGAALAFAWADPSTTKFEASQIAVDNTCECCRIGIAFLEPGKPIMLFRSIFGSTVRDHAVVSFKDRSTAGEVHRVSVDNWVIDGCPHQGPALSVAPDGTLHAVWYTEGTLRQGVFYSRSTDGGETFSTPLALGSAGRQISRPYVLSQKARVWLTWKEFDGEKTKIMVMRSNDAGKSWGSPVLVSETSDASDHPLLISDGQQIYLSWLTKREGYRLLPVGDLS